DAARRRHGRGRDQEDRRRDQGDRAGRRRLRPVQPRAGREGALDGRADRGRGAL
ncbi:MAG: Pyruvate dehydrogenase E1 component alpha subunit, partial [uncultured Acetobacteraceae bacterium]